MWTFLIIFFYSLISILLYLFETVLDLLPEGNGKELILYGPMKALTNPIYLR